MISVKDDERGENGRQTVRAVDRALQLLACFTFTRNEMTLAELSTVSGLPKPTVFRLLAPLEANGFVEKDGKTQTYKLGMAVFRLGQIVYASLELRKLALPVMQELSDLTGETVNLNIVRGGERICVEKVEGKHDLRQFVEIGRSLPLYAGASGKLLLAFLPEKRQREILAGAGEPLTSSPEKVAQQLKQIHDQGYAVSHNERVLGAAAISAPIFDHHQEVVAGLTISGATVRFTDDKVDEFVRMVVYGARKVSHAMGYSGDRR